MGQLRSRKGCLTCRRRHVKCDEARPICGQCGKRQQACEQDDATLQIRTFDAERPRKRRRQIENSTTVHQSELPNVRSEPSSNLTFSPQETSQQASLNGLQDPASRISGRPTYSSSVTSEQTFLSSISSPQSRRLAYPGHGSSLAPTFHDSPGSTSAIVSPVESRLAVSGVPAASSLTLFEARLVHHYARKLGRWLDCTDASRQFTLRIPALVKTSEILLHAVMSFAARHLKDAESADLAHSECVKLLIPRLNSSTAADDDILLCAIVILRVFEQLNASDAGNDQERHLAGTSALLRVSPGLSVDPSSPGLRQAAFWIYMRQCLYNACVNQQPPNVDLDLVLLQPPSPGGAMNSGLGSETAWANTMTWITARVIQFCFSSGPLDPRDRSVKWKEMTDLLEEWLNNRPNTFDPIVWIPNTDENAFPTIFFTADWHVMAFGFYHLAAMLLIIYKPFPRFAIRTVRGGATNGDSKILDHARAICGVCSSCPSVVPSLITLCHTVFIWGPLVTQESERQGILQTLTKMEDDHAWPTAWIVQALNEEWGQNTAV